MAAAPTNRVQVAVATFALFCLALFLTAYSAKNPALARAGSVLMTELLSPGQALYGGFRRSISGVWTGYINLIGVEAENNRIRERLATLEAENSALLEFRHENQRLRGVLGILDSTELKGVVASVIAFDPSNWERTAVIDRGTLSGLQPGMAVIHNNGVVGQVISSGPSTSRVLLLTDHASGIDALVQGSRTRGVVEGFGERQCKLRYVLADEDLKVGDRLITSGMDGVFPKGLLIGIVSDFKRTRSGLFQLVEVRPSVDLARLENVLVVTNPGVSVTDVKGTQEK